MSQGLSQDLRTGCPKLPIVKCWGALFFKEDHNILRLQPLPGKRHNILIQCPIKGLEDSIISGTIYLKYIVPDYMFENNIYSKKSWIS